MGARLLCFLTAALLFGTVAGSPSAQTVSGELQLSVVDAQGLALPGRINVVSEGMGIRKTLSTNGLGKLTVRGLPWGTYLITAEHAGFASLTRTVRIRSALPLSLTMALHPAGSPASITVNASQTLLDPEQAGSVNRIGLQQIQERQASLPGRGLIDLVNSQPGWLYEGNAVLHPRGSEYQTQFVVDGIPLDENRSPGFGSQIEAADVQSLAIYTAGIPAEYGRKMGGVVEVNTLRDIQNGLHGEATFSAGSFSTANAFAAADYGWGRNSAGASASGATTAWYENPPVLQNFTNNGKLGDFSGDYQRQVSASDQVVMSARHEFARFLVPNEQVQESAGQRQHRSTGETMGTLEWQHILSPRALTEVAGMVRDDRVLLSSNALSTPIIAAQDRGFRDGYMKASATRDWRGQEFKAGIEGDWKSLRESFRYQITDPTQFDPGTPGTFTFFQTAPDREEALFAEDMARFGRWTLAPGLRWDDYTLLVHRSDFSPRIALSRYFPAADMTAHLSWDHVFQTPAFENLLLSSSPQVVSLDPEVVRKPVLPSTGNYYEAGTSQAIVSRLRLDTNVYLRRFLNYADDNPLLDTSISFPVAFRSASIFGAEGKVTVPRWGAFSGYASYSYMLGTCYLPVTGGLFLGDEATQALEQLNGRLWVSQDQRNTLRTRWLAHVGRGFWFASGMEYGSGLPVDFNGDRAQALQQYGPELVNRVNFARSRVEPSLSLDVSAAKEWAAGDGVKLRLQADGENINNRINLIDFAGLFSGNAVAPSRSGNLSLGVIF